MKKLVFVFWIFALAVSGCGVTLNLPDANVDHWGLTGTDKVNAALSALNAGKVEWRGSVTEAERDALSSPAVGDLIYNETAGEFEAYDGSAWGVMGGDMTGAELEAALDAYFGSSAWRTQDGTGTDDQQLTRVGDSLTLEDGGSSIDLSDFRDGTGTDDQTAAEVAFTPNGSISATDVQAAIQEVRDEAASATQLSEAALLADGGQLVANTVYGDGQLNGATYSGSTYDLLLPASPADLDVVIYEFEVTSEPLAIALDAAVARRGTTGTTDTVTFPVGHNWFSLEYVNGSWKWSDTGAVTLTRFLSGMIESPSDKDYTLALNLPHGATIVSTTTQCASGTATATFRINATALGGTANSVSATEVEQPHASSNAAAAGDNLVMTISANSSCADLVFLVEYTVEL